MYARKTILIMGSTILTNFIGYLSWYFITNNIPQSFVGSVGFAIAYLGFFGIVVDLGFTSAHIKRISEGKDEAKCIGTYTFIKIVLLTAFVVLALASIWGYRNVYPRRDFANSYDESVIHLMLIWAIMSNLASIIVNTYLGKQQVAKAQAVIVGAAVVQALTTIFIVTRTNDVHMFASTWVVGGAASLGFGILLLGRVRISLPSREYLLSYLKYALPMMLVIGAAPLVLFLDKMMIKLFNTNVDVSIYWNAQKFAALPEAIANSVISVLFPAISSMVSTGMISRVKEITRTAERYLSMFMVPAAFFLIAVATPFVVIFSDVSYESSGLILAILMGWVILKTLSKPYQVHFGGFNRPVYAMYLSLVFIPLNVLLNLIFIPQSLFGIPLLGLGAVGAALASFTGAIVYYLMIRFLSYRLVPIGINVSVIKHLIAGMIMAGSLYLLQHYVYSIDRFYDVIFFAIIGSAIYLAVIWAMGEFRRKDIEFILETMNVGKMFGYLRDELLGRKG